MNTHLKVLLHELRQGLEALYGKRLAGMVLYGSRARNDAEPGSDVDVLVLLNGPVQAGEEISRTGGLVADLSLRYDEVIACTFMEAARYARGMGPLVRNIHREGVPV